MAEVVAESMVGGTTFHREVISVRFPEPWSSTSLVKTTVLKRRGRGLSLTEPSLLSRGTRRANVRQSVSVVFAPILQAPIVIANPMQIPLDINFCVEILCCYKY